MKFKKLLGIQEAAFHGTAGSRGWCETSAVNAALVQPKLSDAFC